MNIEKGQQEETLQNKLNKPNRKRPEHQSPTGERRKHAHTNPEKFKIPKNLKLWDPPGKKK